MNDGKADKSVSGSNYCKMSDGTMIQWGAKDITCDVSAGVFGTVGAKNENYPISFVATPVVMCNVAENAGFWNASTLNVSAGGFSIWLAGDSYATRTVYWLAVGRWK